MEAMLDAELDGQHDFEDDFDALNSGENDEGVPAESLAAAADERPRAGHSEQAGENPDEHVGAAVAAHVQHARASHEEDEGETPRGSENAAGNVRPELRGSAGAGPLRGGVRARMMRPGGVAPARMAAGNAGVRHVDSHSMRSAGGEESTVLCGMDHRDEASIGEACTSRASPWEFGGMLVWGKKRKR
jgi:hypothetical protein